MNRSSLTQGRENERWRSEHLEGDWKKGQKRECSAAVVSGKCISYLLLGNKLPQIWGLKKTVRITSFCESGALEWPGWAVLAQGCSPRCSLAAAISRPPGGGSSSWLILWLVAGPGSLPMSHSSVLTTQPLAPPKQASWRQDRSHSFLTA